MPFVVLYRISDALAWILRAVIKYRVKVVQQNLHNAFPEKSTEELNIILIKSYQNLADILLEGIKGFSLNKKDLSKRYRFNGIEILQKFYKAKKHVVAYGSHYANWEWVPLTLGKIISHRSLGIIKPFKNPYINDYVYKQRTGIKFILCDAKNAFAAINGLLDNPTQFMFVSDQGPLKVKNAHWLRFLNQDTPCFLGAETVARKNNWPVVDYQCTRVKRGFYHMDIVLIEANSKDTKKGEITKKYYSNLEKHIRKKPENWLWSHKRWKRAHLKPKSEKKEL